MDIALPTYLAYLAALFVCGVCVWRGDRPLRLAAAVVIVAWGVTPLFNPWDHEPVNRPQTLIDALSTLTVVWISTRWRRLWAAVLAGFMVLTVLCPYAPLMDARIHRNSWVAANNVLAMCELATLLVALWLTLRPRGRADEGTVQS